MIRAGIEVELRLLGPVEARTDCGTVPFRGAMQGALVALLLLERGAPVSRDRLVDSLWHDPPRTARHALDVHLSALRTTLREHGEPARLLTHPGGYSFRVEEGELDLARFEALGVEARSAAAGGNPRRAASLLRESLALWRGEPLADLGDPPFVAPARRQLEEARLDALGARFEAELASGRRDGLHRELRALVDRYPHVERFVAQCMLALYRESRQAEALELYREHRARLSADLGLVPGTELRELERAILRQEPSLEAPPRAGSPATEHVSSGSLVGREQEVRRCLQAFDEGERLVTLTGPGGVGKSRLAAEIAAVCAGRFERIVNVEISSVVEPELVVPAIAHALGVDEQPDRPLADDVAASIARHATLVVLDAVDHARASGVELARLCRLADDLIVLCTSRTRLALASEWELEVQPLPRKHAVALVVQRARRTRRDFAVTDDNAAAVAAICDRLDGLPLAIELAAARLESLSPVELLERLDRPLSALVGGPRDTPARQRTMRATVAWSVDLLDEAHRRTFARLGTFVGGWTIDAAAEVCAWEAPDDALVDQLSLLNDRSLIRRTGEHAGLLRFEQLDTIRALACDWLLEDGADEDARRRHAEYFVRLAELAEHELGGPSQAGCVERLEAELGNLRAATRWASERGEHELVLRLVGSLWHFWERRRRFREARIWLGDALSAERLDARVRAKALVAQAKFTGRAGAYARATALLEESVMLYQDIDDPAAESRARANLGWVLMVRGDLERAIDECERARALAVSADDRAAVADALNNLASAYLAAERPDDSEPLFQRCLALRRDLGDEHGTVAAIGNLGMLAVRRGAFHRAEELLEESLLLARLVEDGWYVANICVSLAYVSWRLEDVGRADDLLREGLLTAAELGEIPLQAEALDGFAALAASSEDPERAAILSGAASAMRLHVAIPDDPAPSFREGVERLVLERLGPDALRRADARGRRLLPADAVSLALGDDRVLDR